MLWQRLQLQFYFNSGIYYNVLYIVFYNGIVVTKCYIIVTQSYHLACRCTITTNIAISNNYDPYVTIWMGDANPLVVLVFINKKFFKYDCTMYVAHIMKELLCNEHCECIRQL